MDEHPRYRALVEREEYTAQFDAIVSRYEPELVDRVLTGLFWGISTNPEAYDRVIGKIRLARSRSLGLTSPIFTIFFAVENEGMDDEYVLLCWIEESSGIDDLLNSSRS